MIMQPIWWMDDVHRERFVHIVRRLPWWKKVDVEGDPEGFIRNYREYGLFLYLYSCLGKSFNVDRWIAKDDEPAENETYLLNSSLLLEDAAGWSGGERNLVNLALDILDPAAKKFSIDECLGDLDGAFWQAAMVALTWRYNKHREPYYATGEHASHFHFALMRHYPNERMDLAAALYIVSALPQADVLRGFVSQGDGKLDLGALKSSGVWRALQPEDQLMVEIAHHLLHPENAIRLEYRLIELPSNYVRVVTDAMRIAYGQYRAPAEAGYSKVSYAMAMRALFPVFMVGRDMYDHMVKVLQEDTEAQKVIKDLVDPEVNPDVVEGEATLARSRAMWAQRKADPPWTFLFPDRR